MILHLALCPLSGLLRCSFLLGALVLMTSTASAQQDFRRGDANADGIVDIADISLLCGYVHGTLIDHLPCTDAADAQDNCYLDLVDAIYIWGFLTTGTIEIALPGPFIPGPDPTDDRCTCESYAPLPATTTADFTLKLLCPDLPSGTPGETVRWTAYAALHTDNCTAGHGAEAWSLSIAVEGARITGVTTEGTVVEELRSDSCSEKTEAVDSQLDTGSGPQGQGAVSTVLLSVFTGQAHLPAEGTSTLLAITLEAVVPDGGLGPFELSFIDGMKGSGQPVRNVISLDGVAYTPSFGGCERLIPDCNQNGIDDADDIASGASTDCNLNGAPDSCDIAQGASADDDGDGIPDECPGFRFRRGDPNQDSVNDIADAIAILGYLFAQEHLDCLKTADANDSGEVDIADAVYLLSYLFAQGPVPEPPFPECGADTTPDAITCESYKASACE